MAREITAGVLLKLKDQFSSQIRGAGISVQGFADKAAGVAEKVNKAFSGVAGTLGTLGVSIGALSAVKSTVDLDHRLVRLGLTANLSAQEVNELKRTIFEVAQMPDIKLDTDPIISGLEVILEKTGDIGQAGKENIANLARAIQAAGTEGAPMGDVFSEFAKNKFTAEEITKLMDDIITISDMGEYTFVNFANTAKSVLSSYSLIGNTPEDVKNAVIAMQVLTAGTKSADVAATALDSTMRELADTKKRKALESLGINVRDNATGELRDFNDILLDAAEAYKDFRKADYINDIFGSETLRAIRAYGSEFAKNIPRMKDLGDTAGTLAGKSETMANTLRSNFQNLQTAFSSFADKELTGPLKGLMDRLNELAKNPEKIEAGIKGIALALGGLATIKLGAGIVSFVANLKGIRGGKNLAKALTGAGGGAGIPVYVTNWGGAAGTGINGNMQGSGLLDQYGNPLVSTGKPPANQLPASKPARAGAAEKALNYAVPAAVATGLVVAGSKMNEIYSDRSPEGLARKMVLEDTMSRMMYEGYDPSTYIASHPETLTMKKALELVQAKMINSPNLHAGIAVNDLIITPQGRFSTHPDDYIFAMKDPAALIAAGIAPASSRYQTFQGTPGIARHNTNTSNSETVNNLTITPQGQFSARPSDYIPAMEGPAAPITAGIAPASNRYQTFQGAPGVVQYNTNTSNSETVNNLTITPQGRPGTRPEDYIFAMKNPAVPAAAGIAPVSSRYQTFQGAPGVVQHNTDMSRAQTVNGLTIAPQGRPGARPEDYIPATEGPAAPATAGIAAVNNRYQNFQGAPGIVQYNTSTVQGQFSTRPGDYIPAMKNPAALVNSEIRNEMRSVERIPPAIPPVIVEGEIELRSELIIDDKGYRLRQSVGKNTTPYKFAVGSAKNARLIQ